MAGSWAYSRRAGAICTSCHSELRRRGGGEGPGSSGANNPGSPPPMSRRPGLTAHGVVGGQPALIAAELKSLREPPQLAGLEVTWIANDTPTPPGDFVALVPLLSRWVGGTELKPLPKLSSVPPTQRDS